MIGRRDAAWPTSADLAVGAALVAAAWLLTFLHQPGWLLADNVHNFWSDPGEVLLRHLEPWDASRGLGRSTPDFSPIPYAITTVLDALGLPTWAVQRVWYAILLSVSGVGCQLFARCMVPGRPIAHLTAGLVYMANPFVAGYFTPSFLFLHYALVPVAAWSLWRGITGRRPWRWAAVFALVVTVPGILNPPALVLALAPLVLVVAGALLGGDTTWTRVGTWMLGTAALVVALALPAVMQLSAGSSALVDNLAATESLADVSQSSSWSESLRGLGGWGLYWGPGGEYLRADILVLLEHPLVVAATFAAPAVALAAVWSARWRHSWTLTATLCAALVLMVGAFPLRDPTPWGELWRTLLEGSASAFALRSTYKAGPGLQLAVAVLVGFAVDRLYRMARTPGQRSRSSRILAASTAVVLVGLLVTSASPIVDGSLFERVRRTREVPQYHLDAAEWLNARADDTRVLILPTAVDDQYRWGNPGPEHFDTALDRPYIVRSAVANSTAQAHDILDAVLESIERGPVEPSVLAESLRRLGIGYVLVRNDLDWSRAGAPRPSELDWLRSSPGLVPVAAFGRVDQNTVTPGDLSDEAGRERELRPLEVFQVPTATAQSRSASADGAVLVSGDGEGWLSVIGAGHLADDQYVAFTAASERATLHHLEAGAPVIVTDTNRRRQRLFGFFTSYTLTVDDERKGVEDLFAVEGSQTVTDYPGAEVAERPLNKGFGVGSQHRPAAAFDGNLRTSWLTGGLVGRIGQTLTVRLDEPEFVDRIRVWGHLPFGADNRRVESVEVHSDRGVLGTIELAALEDGTASFGELTVDEDLGWVEFELVGVGGEDLSPIGLSEVQIGDLPIREVVVTPDDLFRRADDSDLLEEALSTAPVTYRFVRLGPVDDPEESDLRRSFRTVGTRRYEVSGRLRIDHRTDDEDLYGMLDTGPVRAFSDDRYAGDATSAAPWSVDGRPETTFAGPSFATTTLDVTFPSRQVSTVELDMIVGPGSSVPDTITASSGGRVRTTSIEPPTPCTTEVCVATLPVTIPRGPDGSPVTSVRLQLTRSDRETNPSLFGAPFLVAELRIDGEPNPVADLASACFDQALTIDGRPVPVRLGGTFDDLTGRRALAFEGCERPTLDDDRHVLADGPGTVIDEIELTEGVRPEAEPDLADVGLVGASSSTLTLDVETEAPSLVISGWSYDPRWTAEWNDRPVETLTADGLLAVEVPGTGVVEFRLPHRRLSAALAIAAMTALATIALVLHGGPRRSVPRRARPRPAVTVPLVTALGCLAGFAIGSIPGAVTVGAACAVDQRLRSGWERSFALAGAAMIALAAAATVPPFGPNTRLVGIDYAISRSLANALAQVAAVAMVAGVTVAWRRSTRTQFHVKTSRTTGTRRIQR